MATTAADRTDALAERLFGAAIGAGGARQLERNAGSIRVAR
jgi:hypothetical protein